MKEAKEHLSAVPSVQITPVATPEPSVFANQVIAPTPSSLPSPNPRSEVVSHEPLKTQGRFALSSFAQLPLRLTLVLISLLGGLSVLALMSVVLPVLLGPTIWSEPRSSTSA